MITLEGVSRMLAGLAELARWAALHAGSPSLKGTELAGVHRRQSVSWELLGKGITLRSFVTFDVPERSRITHVGFWSESKGGTLVAWAPVTQEGFVLQGEYTLTGATIGVA